MFEPKATAPHLDSTKLRRTQSEHMFSALPPISRPREDGFDATLSVESRCGAVAVGRTYLFPPLSSGGALVVRP